MRVMKKVICCCDRCGMFYNYYEGGKTFKDTEKANAVTLTDIFIDMDLERDYSYRQIYDLCPECMKKLEKFLNKKIK